MESTRPPRRRRVRNRRARRPGARRGRHLPLEEATRLGGGPWSRARGVLTRPHASRPARDGTPRLFTTMMPFFSGKRRARERFERAACVARSAPRRETRRSVIARAERAPEATERVRRVCRNRSRARVCATSTPTVACRRVKARKRFAFFLAKSARGAQVGRFVFQRFSRGARSEAEPNRESRRSREARASRVEPAAREAETCRTCEYPRATARRGSPEPRAAFRLASRSPARLDPLPPSSNLRPVEICAIPLSTSPR